MERRDYFKGQDFIVDFDSYYIICESFYALIFHFS